MNTMYLIYPGMTSFVPVTVIEPAREPGYVMVREANNPNPIKVAASRLCDAETAARRTHTQIFERKDDMGRYVITETSVTA